MSLVKIKAVGMSIMNHLKISVSLSLVFLFGVLIFTACATSPSGRKQLILLPSSQLNQLGASSFAQMESQKKTNTDPKTVQYVTCITNNLLHAMGQNPEQWQIGVFEDKTPNAFALPGNKMGVHTGMLELAQNQDQLAAVIGHEIGHVLSQHGNERMSQNLVAQLGLQATAISLGRNRTQDQLIFAALGVGLQVGVLLPFSRTHEKEADRLGLKYMAAAGFDPSQASRLWELMDAKNQSSPPEFLSTHPSSKSRIKDLKKRAVAFMDTYNKVNPKPRCRK